MKDTRIRTYDALNITRNTLSLLDPRLMSHGERVAYIACELIRARGNASAEELKNALALSVFHDIGAYKTDEIDRMLEFETVGMMHHSIYGYLFLKHLSPLAEHALSILYHHAGYEYLVENNVPCTMLASLLHIADRIDILVQAGKTNEYFKNQDALSARIFAPELVRLFFSANSDGHIINALRDGTYDVVVGDIVAHLDFTDDEIMQYLQMLVYSIDFRSQNTVTHTINTTAISMALAERIGLDEDLRSDIYYGALFHDIGKIAIPESILEFPGKLSDDEMKIMRSHVVHTDEIIRGIVSENVRRIAVRHHERLDGSGYPYGLTGDELTIQERIVEVADVISALNSNRSYKRAFPKERTLSIIRSEQEHGRLCPKVCSVVLSQYDALIDQTDQSRDAVIATYKNIAVEYEELEQRGIKKGKK